MTWPRVKLKFVARLAYGDALPTDEVHDGPFQVFGSNGPFTSYSRTNTRAPAIVVGRKGSYGKVNWSPDPCFVSDTTFFVDESTTRNHLRWVFWVLQTLRLDEGTDEAAVPGLSREWAYSRYVLVPPLPQQRAIADYLDRETTRIGELIAAKERVLELLAEKRRALITRAVTRGLDPHAPLRDSGIPWLGVIPAHWEVLPIKYGFATIGSGTTPPSGKAEYYEGDFPWVTTSELRENTIHETSQSIGLLAMREFTALRLYPPGSVLFAMYGATTGRVAMLGVAATVNQAVCVLSGARRWLPAFAFYSLQASRDALTSEALGGGQPNLNAEKVKNHRLACPSLPEQKAITEHIERGTKKLDELSAFTTRTIELLRERRSALIAAAVTGQIDVEVAA